MSIVYKHQFELQNYRLKLKFHRLSNPTILKRPSFSLQLEKKEFDYEPQTKINVKQYSSLRKPINLPELKTLTTFLSPNV